MIAVLSVISFVMVGICAVAVGQLLQPLMSEFGWKNSAVSLLATVYSLASLLSGPPVGLVIDRFGSKRVMISGVILSALGFLCLSQCRTLGEFYATFVVIGIGYGAAFFLASTTLVARRMGDQKNLGMGTIMGAGSSGAALFSVLIGGAVTYYGWRHAAMVAALLMFALLPLFAFIPVRDQTVDAVLDKAPEFAPSDSAPLAVFATPEFLTIVAASALAGFGMSGIYFHAMPIFLKAGYSNATASAVLGASWVLSALGSVITGALGNRLGSQNVLAGSLLASAIGTTFLAFLTGGLIGVFSVMIFIVVWGATANAVNQFLPIVLAERFGSTHLGALTGVQGAVMGIVGSIAPFATGMIYDTYASYRVSIMASTLATLAAFGLVILFKRQAIYKTEVMG